MTEVTMPKTVEQLQAELNREMTYSAKLNEKIDKMREQLRNCISKDEHEKIVADIRREYEQKLSQINLQQPMIHNERGAGRKKIATKEVASRVLELREQGLSQAKIADTLTQEFDMKIGRTTIGEIVRGNYVLLDEK